MDKLLILTVLISLVFLVVLIFGFIIRLSRKDTCFCEIPNDAWFDFAISVLKKTYVLSMLALLAYVVIKLRLFTFRSLIEHTKANILGIVSLAAVLFFSSILSLFGFAACLGIIESFTGSHEKEKKDLKRTITVTEGKRTREANSRIVVTKQELQRKREVTSTDLNVFDVQNNHLLRGVSESPKVKKSIDLNRVDMMNALQFEEFCVVLLKHNGFRDVTTTPQTGDQGVDIIAIKDGIRHAIQCKHYKTNVGNSAVQEVHTGKTFYHCSVGVVLTNSNFTSSAQELAKASQTLLWDRAKLKKMMENME